jgi:hypothetical protein
MKTLLSKIVSVTVVWGLLAAFYAPGAAAQKAPQSLVGFTLGQDIAKFRDRLQPDSEYPMRYLPLVESEIIAPAGILNGLVYYATCAQPGAIVRVRIKYADDSLRFFERLMDQLKKRLGKPDQWRGDPFGHFKAWKWGFVDDGGNTISLIVEHNLKDPEQNLGNTIKLTMTNLLETERRCAQEKKAAARASRPSKAMPQDLAPLLPQ